MSLVRLLSLCALPFTAEAAKLLASHYNGNLYSLDLSDAGRLSITSQISSGARLPAWITLDSAAKTAYFPDESWFGSGTLTSFNVGSDGRLTAAGKVQTKGGELHSSLYGGQNGDGFIANANYEGPYINTYKLPLQSNAQAVQTIQFKLSQNGPNPRQNKAHPHSIFPDPTGKFLVVPDLGADEVRVFSADSNSGRLTECPSGKTGAGAGPRHGAFTKIQGNKTILYTVNELGNSVTFFTVNYQQGGCMALNAIQTISTFPQGTTAPQGAKAAELHVSGSFVYASNRFDRTFGSSSDSLAAYNIDTATGRLTLQGLVNSHTYFPRTFVINKKGDLVAVGGQTSANVAILERNVTTGAIGRLVGSIDVGSKGRENEEDGLSAVVWVE